MSLKEHFEIPGRYKTWSWALMGVGILSLIIGYMMYGSGDGTRFWSTMLHNSVYFLLVVNAAMFFFCATSLALGGWQLSFRRVTEAVSASVIPIGIITFVILLCLVFGNKYSIYEWLDKDLVNRDEILKGKKGFLNPTFFTVWTTLTIGLWILLGMKMRKISREIDDTPLTVEEGKRYIFKKYGLVFSLHRMVCIDCCFHCSLALADEHQCALVLDHVQLVYICQHFCGRHCTDDLICYLFKKPGIPGIY